MLKPRIAVYTLVAAASLATAGYQPVDSAIIEAPSLVSRLADESPVSGSVSALSGTPAIQLALAALGC